ncbi:MAG: hypothetical protein LUQ27_00950, partial [Methanomassiliicoccales archaeon]|nr:hypothetical protein [Methanomassiliicoccales archaeon]
RDWCIVKFVLVFRCWLTDRMMTILRRPRMKQRKEVSLDAKTCNVGSMNLTNESYVITISGRNSVEFYYRHKNSWYKVSTRGRKFKATAAQVLNHVLPALAGVRSNITINVEHYEDPEKRVLVGPRGVEAI